MTLTLVSRKIHMWNIKALYLPFQSYDQCNSFWQKNNQTDRQKLCGPRSINWCGAWKKFEYCNFLVFQHFSLPFEGQIRDHIKFIMMDWLIAIFLRPNWKIPSELSFRTGIVNYMFMNPAQREGWIIQNLCQWSLDKPNHLGHFKMLFSNDLSTLRKGVKRICQKYQPLSACAVTCHKFWTLRYRSTCKFS